MGRDGGRGPGLEAGENRIPPPAVSEEDMLPPFSYFCSSKRFCRFSEQIVLFRLLILKRTFKAILSSASKVYIPLFFFPFEMSRNWHLEEILFQNYHKCYSIKIWSGGWGVCMHVHTHVCTPMPKKIIETLNSFVFSIKSESSESDTQLDHEVLVRNETWRNFFFKLYSSWFLNFFN